MLPFLPLQSGIIKQIRASLGGFTKWNNLYFKLLNMKATQRGSLRRFFIYFSSVRKAF